MADTKYDIIIIGAGPNGLALGSYLSRAGEKVLILEKRLEVGGGLATEAVTTGACLHNTHAVYMMMVDYAPIYKDFELEERYKVRHIQPDLQFAMPLSDGRCLCLYSDLERTCNSIAQFSKRDADSFRELYHTAKRCVDGFVAPATYVPPLPALDQVVVLQKSEIGRIVLEFSEKSPQEIVDEHFENEHVRALMLYVTTKWGVPPDQTGLGYLVLLYLNRAMNYRLTVGGSHMVAQALHKLIHESGGRVRTNERIQRIIVEGNVAKGVELEDGTVLHAEKAVVSTVDPHQTFLRFVGEQNQSEEFVDKIKGWQWEKHVLMGVHLALQEAPNFTAAASNPEIDKAFIYVLGYETPEALIRAYEAMDRGELSQTPGFNCCFPTVHDPLQAPPGKHTGLLSCHVPYNLKEGADRWYGIKFKEEVAERCLTTLRKYAPNMTEDKIMWKYISTPVDIQNKFLDMVEGSFKQGEYSSFQMGYLRPNEECSMNRTPIKNLYLGGASCYPGGCVIWGPGYLAANTLAEDLGIKKWWSEPEIVTKARDAGVL